MKHVDRFHEFIFDNILSFILNLFFYSHKQHYNSIRRQLSITSRMFYISILFVHLCISFTSKKQLFRWISQWMWRQVRQTRVVVTVNIIFMTMTRMNSSIFFFIFSISFIFSFQFFYRSFDIHHNSFFEFKDSQISDSIDDVTFHQFLIFLYNIVSETQLFRLDFCCYSSHFKFAFQTFQHRNKYL